MITDTGGNLLRDDAQALVNTVNTVGVMGKGIALQFKRAFPEVFTEYAAACAEGRVRPGRVLPVRLEDGDRWVLNFPTKRHWRENSRLEDIRSGLDDLVRLLLEHDIRSVALPPLGCGNGGLDWSQVRPLIVERLGGLDVDVRLYGGGTPAPRDMPTRTAAPALTRPHNRLLAGLGRYVALAFESGIAEAPRLSLLEAHKVAYLLQRSGSRLGLRFVPHIYGPFSTSLNDALAAMEGHYLNGYGDGTEGARADLRLAAAAVDTAEAAAASDADFERSWEKTRQAVAGYEYPEGMELLTTVHCLATRPGGSADPDVVAAEVADWSERKRKLYQPSDITAALYRLRRAELLDAS